MKLTPIDIHDIPNNSLKGRNMDLVIEFIESDMNLAEVTDHKCKNAKSFQSSMIWTLKRMNLRNTIGIMIRKERVFIYNKKAV